MALNFSEKDNSVIVNFSGKLSGLVTDELNEVLHNKIDEGKTKVIAVLSDVSFITSTGLGALISGYTTMKNAGGDFVLANLNKWSVGLLSKTKLDSVFKQYPTIEEALKNEQSS